MNVCRNLFFGEPQRFEMYNGSKVRETVEQKGRTLDFPAVGSHVGDWLYSKRKPIRSALPEMPFGTRAELKRWRKLCAKLFDEVIGG